MGFLGHTKECLTAAPRCQHAAKWLWCDLSKRTVREKLQFFSAPCHRPVTGTLGQVWFPHEILEFIHNLYNVLNHQNLHKRTFSH